MANLELAESFAKAYNYLNASYLEPALADQFEYSSFLQLPFTGVI